jgi:putative peptidoglycan lipid II flippase
MADRNPSSDIGRASALLASGTLVSRILGFISAAVLAAAIGLQGSSADTFTLANQLPNNIYAVIAGGLLTAVLVPQIVRASLHDDGGQKFINRIITLGVILFLGITILATLSAPLLVGLYAQSGPRGFSSDEMALAIAFAYWCLPQLFFYALYTLLGEVLNARRVFGPFTWAPALNNLIAIGGLVLFMSLYGGAENHMDASSWTVDRVAVLAGSATLGIAAQALVLGFFWRRAGLKYRPEFQWRGVGLGSTGKAAAWVFGMVLATQIAGIVETNVATLASGEGDASLAIMRYGWLIFMLPHSIVTVSIATAYFTRMSKHASAGDISAVRNDVSSSLRVILMFMVFAWVGLFVLAWPFSAVFGATYAEVGNLTIVLMAYLAGLIPFTVIFVLHRVFFSLEDTRTPFLVQLVQVILYISMALLIGAYVPTQWIAVSLAAAISIAGLIQTILVGVLLHRRVGGLGMRTVARQSAWFLLAALPAAAVGIGIIALLGGVGAGSFPVTSPLGGITTMALSGSAMLAVYCAILLATKNPEFLAFLRPVFARIRRSS